MQVYSITMQGPQDGAEAVPLQDCPAACQLLQDSDAAVFLGSVPEEPRLSLEECRVLEKERCGIGLRVRFKLKS